MTGLSFEFFPPRSERAAATLRRTARDLAALSPDYFSVTHGTGSDGFDPTLDTLDELARHNRVPTVAHLCHGGMKRADVTQTSKRLWNAGHRRTLALRGDDDAGQGFSDTAEFVRALREAHDFEIAVACYPETHPLAVSPEADLEVLHAKQEAGATHALSQFFFDNDVFFDFVARARSAGITIPIVPGVLPVHNIEKAVAFGERCGSRVPEWVLDRFKRADDTATARRVAKELIETQVTELAVHGADGLHIYALNKSALALEAGRAWNEAREAAARPNAAVRDLRLVA